MTSINLSAKVLFALWIITLARRVLKIELFTFKRLFLYFPQPRELCSFSSFDIAGAWIGAVLKLSPKTSRISCSPFACRLLAPFLNRYFHITVQGFLLTKIFYIRYLWLSFYMKLEIHILKCFIRQICLYFTIVTINFYFLKIYGQNIFFLNLTQIFLNLFC